MAASLGKPSTNSRIRASQPAVLTEPTFKPKLRCVPRTSLSTSISALDQLAAGQQDPLLLCSQVFTCTGLADPHHLRDAARLVSIGFVDRPYLKLSLHVSCLGAHALFSNVNPKPSEFQQAEVLAAHERLKGRDPRELAPDLLGRDPGELP
jgi:hypothetical protein